MSGGVVRPLLKVNNGADDVSAATEVHFAPLLYGCYMKLSNVIIFNRLGMNSNLFIR